MKFGLLVIIFILAACNDSAPKLSELGATNINQNENIGFNSNHFDIASPNDSLEISGRCEARHHYLEVSTDGKNWVNAQTLFGTTGSDLNCKDGSFNFILPRVGDYFSFQSGNVGNEGKPFFIRGNLGFTQTNSKQTLIRSGDFTPPGIPKFNTISDYDNPQIRLTEKPTDTDISHYECRWNNSSWVRCFEKTDAENSVYNLSALIQGQETSVNVRAVDAAGNTSESHSKSIRRGQIGRGFDGEVKGLVKIADDRYLAYGSFNYYEAEVARGFARLSPEGVFDPTFKLGFGVNSGLVNDFDFDSNNNILLVGSFTEYSKRANPRITKLLPDGTFSMDFATNSGFTQTPSRIEHEGSDLFRVDFLDLTAANTYKGSSFTGNSIRIDHTGAKDPAFTCPTTIKYLKNMIRTSSGSYAVLSSDQTSLSTKKLSLAHFNSDCVKQNDILNYTDVSITMDEIQFYNDADYTTSGASWIAFSNIFSLNNKLYLGGNFNSIAKNSTTYSIASSLAEFSLLPAQPFLDSGLITPTVTSVGTNPTDFLRTWYSINSVDENLLVLSSTRNSNAFYYNSSNTLSAYNPMVFSQNTNSLTEYGNRLYGVDGRIKVADKTSHALDTTLDNIFSNLNLLGVRKLKFHSDYLYVAGSFTRIRNLTKQSTNLILIDGKGNLVKAYTGISKLNDVSTINKIVSYGSKYIVAGDFSQMLGTTRNNFAVLNLRPDYTLEVDPSFPNISISGEVKNIAIDSDQSIYLTGNITLPKRGLIKVLANGSRDSTFGAFGAPGSSTYANVYSILIHNDKIYLAVPSKFITDQSIERNCSYIVVINKNGEYQNCLSTTTQPLSMKVSGNHIFFLSYSATRLDGVFAFDHTSPTPTPAPLVHSSSCSGYFANHMAGGGGRFTLQTDDNSISIATGLSITRINKTTLACEKITPLIKEGFMAGLYYDDQFSLVYGNYTLTENGKSHHSLAKIFNSSGTYTIDTQSFGDEH